MAKDLGGFMKSFAGNLGGDMSGLGLAGNPLSGIGILKQLMGGHGGEGGEKDNPGQQMFKGVGPGGVNAQGGGNPAGNSFLQKFGGNLSDQLFQKAMMGFMNGNGPY